MPKYVISRKSFSGSGNIHLMKKFSSKESAERFREKNKGGMKGTRIVKISKNTRYNSDTNKYEK